MSTQTTTLEGQPFGPAVLLSAEDREKLLHRFNKTGWDYHEEETLVSLFRKQAGLHPENIAVVCQDQSITYEELDKKSNQLANALIAKGVKEGMYIPVWLDRSLEWTIAILGILKAGAAYVPIDPAYPVKRVEYILTDTSSEIIVTNQLLGALLTTNESIEVLVLDPVDVLDHLSDQVDIKISHNALAYTIYTSGSTGKPKGVMITHHAIQHLVTWHNHHFHVDHTSKLTVVAGLAFDISVWEVWSALTSGGTVFIADHEERTNSSALVNFYRKNQITHGFVPTVLAPAVVEETQNYNDLTLKYLFTGGEKLKPVLTSELNYELVDYYGPTECTVFATFKKVKDVNGQYFSSIGKPIANAKAYILGEKLELLPVGAIGELYIGGKLLAKGYLNNEELTAEKFITNPFNESEKLYRTGDLARWHPDGDIEFLGRIDNQVKIRGFRVELGEIERTLAQQENIREAVVITKDSSGSNNKYLVAFIVQESCAEKNVALVRSRLKEELPGYMVPAQIIFIDKIPITANGKTDTHILKDLADREARELVSFEPPTNETERVIADIWSEELERPVINITDNFFDIGGNSLLVAIVAVALETRLGIKVYLRDIYQYPVLQQLSETLITRSKAAREAIAAEDMEPYVELQKDVYLAPGTVFAGGFNPKQLENPSAIFLTGVTGFVGIHLLQELLDTTNADIYCLVRAQDEFHAMEKIDRCYKQYHISQKNIQKPRIIPVIGDLSLPSLGLSGETFTMLAEKTDLIYHSGSSVNFIEPYSYMKAPNVEGLREIIRLAGAERTKCLALLSTISVYSWGHRFTGKTEMLESDDISQNLMSVSKDIGYVRSKWVMEAIADLAAQEGLPLITYRLGYAMCHSETGASAPYQWWSGLVKNCVEFRSYPALTELREGLITVDYMTRSMAYITKNRQAIGKKFNLIASPKTNLTLEDFFNLINQYYPFALKSLPYKEWRKQWENDSKNRLYPLTSLFRDNMHEGLSTVELYQNTYVWDCTNVIRFLEGSGINEPVFDKKILDAYLNYLGIPIS